MSIRPRDFPPPSIIKTDFLQHKSSQHLPLIRKKSNRSTFREANELRASFLYSFCPTVRISGSGVGYPRGSSFCRPEASLDGGISGCGKVGFVTAHPKEELPVVLFLFCLGGATCSVTKF